MGSRGTAGGGIPGLLVARRQCCREGWGKESVDIPLLSHIIRCRRIRRGRPRLRIGSHPSDGIVLFTFWVTQTHSGRRGGGVCRAVQAAVPAAGDTGAASGS
eukprot:12158282-Ditylum_brightwellii.AAC.1